MRAPRSRGASGKLPVSRASSAAGSALRSRASCASRSMRSASFIVAEHINPGANGLLRSAPGVHAPFDRFVEALGEARPSRPSVPVRLGDDPGRHESDVSLSGAESQATRAPNRRPTFLPKKRSSLARSLLAAARKSRDIEDAPGLWPTLPPVAVYVISDLHLDENDDARLFRDDRQGRALASLCEQIAHDGAELVLLGDIFDLTAMTPPERGLRRFFARLAVEAAPRPRRPVAALVRAGARANPHAIDALARLSDRVRVTLVPGNHDHQLASAEGGAALAAVGLRGERTRSVVRTISGRP